MRIPVNRYEMLFWCDWGKIGKDFGCVFVLCCYLAAGNVGCERRWSCFSCCDVFLVVELLCFGFVDLWLCCAPDRGLWSDVDRIVG